MENNKLPCYSVLMTVYKNDNPRWVDLALQSMLEQTVIPSEIVLIEDGPVSEEIESVISKYIAFNSVPIRLYKNDVNIGLGATLKKVLNYVDSIILLVWILMMLVRKQDVKRY